MNRLLDGWERILKHALVLAPTEVGDGWTEEWAIIKSRLSSPARAKLVGIVGGTGTGKSSLLNALAREELAEVSPRRPTTSFPQAWVPPDTDSASLSRLANLDIRILPSSGEPPPVLVILVDLPDIDSTHSGHQTLVRSILPWLDAVLWVTDPDKYADRRWLGDFVSTPIFSATQNIFVVNKVDRLSHHETDLIQADLVEKLSRYRIENPTVLLVAADPEIGLPTGIDQLWETMIYWWSTPQKIVEWNLFRLDRLTADITGRLGLDHLDKMTEDETIRQQITALCAATEPSDRTEVVQLYLHWWHEFCQQLGVLVEAEAEDEVKEGLGAVLDHLLNRPAQPTRPPKRRWWRWGRNRSAPAPTDLSKQEKKIGEELDRFTQRLCQPHLRPRQRLRAAVAEYQLERDRYQFV